ncbi:hypothetical protein CLAFUW4_10626 [Fulvia fulva]|uniref:Uncharacterized protein n=1 Tax=Passalora fulva TaxID=5499 RepID=A0A9Q8LGR5_PASFU|nr:uncharacterized protein CLAFUR5_05239 [Fulvia fulva]KAK4615536.1 hypothetical protein CLAFUR4_10631 [Fulvia fulva]KAK4616837.1 hypothetical protein CLAFUR0_10613 [Fulvia fulva]UJO17097.1 hypothetical protein CLAFUR5_05239 [Fulvia fulva]WPV19423.1 hypothetical protein CLAFUW4_10626 [Fulvia fulva]WPV33989.1 hypothetical protein CLAFUW7_10628 [Fulvia fulva]
MTWVVITRTFRSGQPFMWSNIPDPTLSVQQLQVNLTVSIYDHASFTALLHHLKPLPSMHSRVRRLRIRLDFLEQIRENEPSFGAATQYVRELNLALEHVHWVHNVVMEWTIAEHGLEDVLPESSWQRDSATDPVPEIRTSSAISPPGAGSTMQQDTRDREQIDQVHQSATHPDPHAVWTTVRPLLDDEHRFNGWRDRGNYRNPDTIQHLQVELAGAMDHPPSFWINPAWLRAIPGRFPAVRCLRLRVDFNVATVEESHRPLVVQWVYRRLYRTSGEMQWPHTVEVLLAINDGMESTFESFDIVTETSTDVVTARFQKIRSWQPLFTILPPSSTVDKQTVLSRVIPQDHQVQMTLTTQQRRPLYTGYRWQSMGNIVHISEDTVAYQAQTSALSRMTPVQKAGRTASEDEAGSVQSQANDAVQHPDAAGEDAIMQDPSADSEEPIVTRSSHAQTQGLAGPPEQTVQRHEPDDLGDDDPTGVPPLDGLNITRSQQDEQFVITELDEGDDHGQERDLSQTATNAVADRRSDDEDQSEQSMTEVEEAAGILLLLKQGGL